MTIKEARDKFAQAFAEDENFRFSYQSNIAMLIYDDQRAETPRIPTNLSTGEGCNSVADRLIKLIFEN